MNAAAQILNLLAVICATLILWRAESALSGMGGKTHWMIRYAMLLLAGGSLGMILAIVSGASIDFITLALLAGISLLLLCERRLRFLARNHTRGNRHA